MSWESSAQFLAVKLLKEKIEAGEIFSSWPFKQELRVGVGDKEEVSQVNVSKFLQNWWSLSGEEDGYKRVLKTTRDGSEYFEYSPIS